MSFRYLLAAIPLLLAIGAGLGVGWYVNERLRPEPTVAPPAGDQMVAPPAGNQKPAAGARSPAADTTAPEPARAAVEPRVDDPRTERSEPEVAMTADAGREVRAEATGRVDDAPALARDAEVQIEPAVAGRVGSAETSTTKRKLPDQEKAERRAPDPGRAPDPDGAAPEGAGRSTAAGPAQSAGSDLPATRPSPAPPRATPVPPSAGADARDQIAAVAPARSGDASIGRSPPLPDDGGRRPADSSPAERKQEPRAAPPPAPDDAGAHLPSEPPEAGARTGRAEAGTTRTTPAGADERPEEHAAGEATASPDAPDEEAAQRPFFDLKALGERIARLFGRGADDGAPEADQTDLAAAGSRPRDAPASADPPRRSLSEESVRQAVRAAVASDPDVEPAPGPRDKVEPPPEDHGKPSFDIFRLERDGSAVIAGRAGPGAKVEVRAGEKVIDRVTADRRGNWVSIPPDKLAAGEHVLSLAALRDQEPVLESPGVVVIRVPGSPPPQPAEVRLAEGPPPQPPATAMSESPGEEPLAILPAVSTNEPLAVLLPRDGGGTGRILQAPGRIESDGQLALLVLDYDLEGRVQIAGEGPAGAPVQVYVDNEPAGEVVVAEDGTWKTVLDERVGPGTYALRLDQLDPDGRPAARLETPFTRVDKPPREGAMDIDYVVVQPGNSLWRIARRLSGKGMRYVHIFESNQGQIRDPDLIYPGQVFEVPPSFGSAG